MFVFPSWQSPDTRIYGLVPHRETTPLLHSAGYGDIHLADWAVKVPLVALDPSRPQAIRYENPILAHGDDMGDYCGSLMRVMARNPMAREYGHNLLLNRWPEPIEPHRIATAAKVRYSDKQDTFFHVPSFAQSKGKRRMCSPGWHPVPPWADGSYQATVRFLNYPHAYGARFRHIGAYRDVIRHQVPGVDPSVLAQMVAKEFKGGDLERFRACEALALLVESLRTARNSTTLFDTWVSLAQRSGVLTPGVHPPELDNLIMNF